MFHKTSDRTQGVYSCDNSVGPVAFAGSLRPIGYECGGMLGHSHAQSLRP